LVIFFMVRINTRTPSPSRDFRMWPDSAALGRAASRQLSDVHRS